MVMHVLQNKEQILKSRQILQNKGVYSTESLLILFLRRLGLVKRLKVGDVLKSWDVYSTLNFIQMNINKCDAILDIGCYASEVIVALHKFGYTNLSGADLNPGLRNMPYQDSIHYEICNFMETKFKDSSFKAITSISVIEHGFTPDKLLNEVSRLLVPDGYFIASFDYWPDKVDTTGINFFGLDWIIFSKQDINDFIEKAAHFGLFPMGQMHYDSNEKTINCGGKKYTFGWMVLKKCPKPKR